MRALFLDTTVLADLISATSPNLEKAIAWLDDLLRHGVHVVIPAVVEYEFRRGLDSQVLKHKSNAPQKQKAQRRLADLDDLLGVLGYSTAGREVMLKASALWANARSGGYPLTSPDKLDIDTIICAHSMVDCGGDCMIATANLRDLRKHTARANIWSAITRADLA